MKFFEKLDYGIRLGRLEIYQTKWAKHITLKEKLNDIGILNGHCGCIIIEFVLFGFTWLGPSWTCEGGTSE